ncbi:hypothetical protein AGR2A_pb10184 [Agrobacterium genomosp. 2 str. CFBP 5494]|uniref:Uncharacterized protein n=1 Tax=Agrobacterium genomosp. 2 str. CFBP 5494 TaxID=1183436 RepID=A0A9W5B7N5_9HYPH|nr:hypothetical protein AGR2A_pb10184 [Agrobacterium genomosp. 2 str. CFBP 5494]
MATACGWWRALLLFVTATGKLAIVMRKNAPDSARDMQAMTVSMAVAKMLHP